MRKELRKQQIRLRRNFFPTLIIIFFLWLLFGAIIYFVDPDTIGALPLFFLLFFLASFLTFSTLFAHSRRGFIASVGCILFLVLRYLGVGNIINLLLIFGLGITAELYFSKQ